MSFFITNITINPVKHNKVQVGLSDSQSNGIFVNLDLNQKAIGDYTIAEIRDAAMVEARRLAKENEI